MTLPIVSIHGIELLPTGKQNIVQVRPVAGDIYELPFDRFVRLKACADAIVRTGTLGNTVLDVGGFDGALALFLDSMIVHLTDPETTGGSGLEIDSPDKSYDYVSAIDVLEHVEPSKRSNLLSECARVTGKYLILNYPCRESIKAQELVLSLTNNEFVRQHVEWPLPDSLKVIAELESLGFSCQLFPHTNCAIWVAQYTLQNLMPEKAQKLSRYLVEFHAEETPRTPLYHLIVAQRVN